LKSKNKTLQKKLASEKIFKSALLTLKSFLPLIISHHPECEHFKGHTIKLGRVRLCIGCYIGYPSAILGILLIDILNLRSFFSLQAFQNIGILFLLFFFLSFTGITNIKIIKIVQKFLTGIGSSFLFWSIWYQPISYNERYFTFATVFGLIIAVLNLYHVYGFYRNCHRCDTPFGWHVCTGFESIRLKVRSNNLGNFFETFEGYSEKIVQKRKRKES